MNYIGLMVVPGNGYDTVEVADGTTVADLVQKHNLHGRTISLDGTAVDPSDYSTKTLDGVGEIWAQGGAKGAN